MRRLTAIAVVIAIAIVVVSAVTGSAQTTSNTTPSNTTARTAAAKQAVAQVASGKLPSCKDPSSSGALHVSGNKLLNSSNQEFVPYGITTFGGLEDGGSNAVWEAGTASANAQIKASKYWHSNTVRLQVAEENFFNHANAADGVNKKFANALCKEVQAIRKQGQEAVISDQTEWPDWTESLPTNRTVAFWRAVGAIYKNQPGVSFDLYNEPRLFYKKPAADYHGHYPKINPNWVWKLWHNGGKTAGQNFVGMQTLASDVRNLGANNVLWIEGPYYDDSLGTAKDFPIRTKGIVWEVHHPPLDGTAYWNKFDGYLAAKYPMVDGEWGQYASNRPECRPNSYKMVPAYLNYLHSKNIGVLGWSLQPGAMLADPKKQAPTNETVARDTKNAKDLEKPSRMYKNYKCTNSEMGEGAGRMLLNEFKRYSKSA